MACCGNTLSVIAGRSTVQVSGALAGYMRPTTDRWVMAGPLFQPIRGVVFALAFYPLRSVLFGRKNGWLIIICTP